MLLLGFERGFKEEVAWHGMEVGMCRGGCEERRGKLRKSGRENNVINDVKKLGGSKYNFK